MYNASSTKHLYTILVSAHDEKKPQQILSKWLREMYDASYQWSWAAGLTLFSGLGRHLTCNLVLIVYKLTLGSGILFRMFDKLLLKIKPIYNYNTIRCPLLGTANQGEQPGYRICPCQDLPCQINSDVGSLWVRYLPGWTDVCQESLIGTYPRKINGIVRLPSPYNVCILLYNPHWIRDQNRSWPAEEVGGRSSR